MRIGVTGGIASGKSLVVSILEGLGAFVVDADEVYHGLIKPGMPLFNGIVARWGDAVLEDGHLDRKRLGAIVFSEPEERKYLEEITHPAIIKAIEERLGTTGADHQVLVAPLLLESGQRHLVDQVWLVVVDSEIRISRLMARENIPREDAMKRIASQMPDEEKIRQASEIIDNNGTPEETAGQVKRLWERIYKRAL
ncbi:MAG: dephospho-CoA kinase [Candidatus Xenobiia bacterium LiM19]